MWKRAGFGIDELISESMPAASDLVPCFSSLPGGWL